MPSSSASSSPASLFKNAYVESFNGKFRDECLNEHWFTGLDEAREVIEEWRQDYNAVRPHSSLDDLTPEQFRDRTTLPGRSPRPPKRGATHLRTGQD